MILEYVWTDAQGNARSKIKVTDIENPDDLSSYPDWNYDGSSTEQADSENSEVIIKPVKICKNPFIEGNIVLCETWTKTGPHPTNTRYNANKIFDNYLHEIPMFGIEQEFFLSRNKNPLGFENSRYPEPQGKYYCGVGEQIMGRECVERAMVNCIKAGLKITGMNAEVAPSQWEIQVCSTGINAADELILLRYILQRTAEQYHWSVDFHPKPKFGDWNGSGCHTNFSTESMRNEGGYQIILKAMEKLRLKHDYHMKNYGIDNNLRMTGDYETSSYDKFSFGVGSRKTSVRIPHETYNNQCGYFEDRRPSSNMDPYVVTSTILKTVME